MPYFRFTLVYEGGFASRLISAHDNLIIEPQIRHVFLSDLQALNVRMPTAADQIRIYEPGSISLDFLHDPSAKGLGYGRYLYVEKNQDRDSRIFAVKKTRSIHRIGLSQISFLSSAEPFVDKTFTVNNRSRPEPVPPPSPKKRPLSAADANNSITASTSQNNFKRIRLSNGMTTAQFKESRINSIENTLKSLSLIKTEPSSPRRLTTSLSSNKAASISNYNTRAPYPQNPTIASQSMQSFPKLEYTETLVPALPQRINYARPPRCPRSTSAIHPTRPLHLDSADPSNSTVRKQHRTYTRRPTSPDPTGKLSVTQKINHFTRELWDTRREISAAQAREKALEMSLQSLNPGDGSIAKPVSDIIESKAARERRLYIESRLQEAEAALHVEQKRREAAEKCLEDVERECSAPFVVPALLQTFMKISQISKGDVLDGISG